MKVFLIALVSSVLGYMVMAFVGYFLVMMFSSNKHDREMEAAIIAAFVAGPIGLILGIIVGYFVARNRR